MRISDWSSDVCSSDLRPLFHVAVAGAEIAQDRADLGEIGGGLFGRAQVRLRHDLHQRHAGPVPVDERHTRMMVVQALSRVLLQVQAGHAEGLHVAVGQVDFNLPIAMYGMGVVREWNGSGAVRGELEGYEEREE